MTNKSKDRVRKNTSNKINARIDNKIKKSIQQALEDKDIIDTKINTLSSEWDIERWLEMNASLIALLGVLLGFFVNIYWLILPMLVLLFLFQHAVQGWCPPIPIFRRLQVRTQKEIDEEIYALKIVRGDFDKVHANKMESIINAIRK